MIHDRLASVSDKEKKKRKRWCLEAMMEASKVKKLFSWKEYHELVKLVDGFSPVVYSPWNKGLLSWAHCQSYAVLSVIISGEVLTDIKLAEIYDSLREDGCAVDLYKTGSAILSVDFEDLPLHLGGNHLEICVARWRLEIGK